MVSPRHLGHKPGRHTCTDLCAQSRRSSGWRLEHRRPFPTRPTRLSSNLVAMNVPPTGLRLRERTPHPPRGWGPWKESQATALQVGARLPPLPAGQALQPVP